jgi:hypothetical protein
MFIARAMCGLTVRNSSCLVIRLQSAAVSQTVTGSFQWSWTISVNVNEETHNHGSRTPYISLVTPLFTVHTKQKPEHLTWGLLRVCPACPTARLNLKFELRSSWNNIQDTFPTGNAQDTTTANDNIFIFGLSVMSRKWLNSFIDIDRHKLPLQKLEQKYSKL